MLTSPRAAVRLRYLVLSACVVMAATAVLAGCGGGGGSSSTPPPPPAPTFSLDTTTLTFTAASAVAPTPPDQTVTATVTGSPSGTLYILVGIAGQGILNVSNFVVTSGNAGQGTVSVEPPTTLGVGTYAGTITVQACLNDQTCKTGELAGSPRTINVTYTISAPVVADVALPRVLVAGSSGEVVLRGSGFTGSTGASFGGTAAKSVAVISDTEIHATYPTTLAPGTLAVSLVGSATPFAANVVVVAPQAYAAATLTYPRQPYRIEKVVFDAARQVLYVAADMTAASIPPADAVLWRYVYGAGAWSAAQEISITDLQDVTLSNDGASLYVATRNNLQVFDATAPSSPIGSPLAAPSPPGAGFWLKQFALANDGNAVTATEGQVSFVPGNGPSEAYLWSPTPSPGVFAALGNNGFLTAYQDGGSPDLVSSADGTLVFATQGGLPTLQYSPVSGLITPTTIQIVHISDQPAAVDDHATRLAVYAGTDNRVYDASAGTYTLHGTIPATSPTTVRVVIVNPAGTRAFALGSDSVLHSYDLTQVASGSNLPEVGSGTALAIPDSAVPQTFTTLRTAVTPDGSTLFVAGAGGVAIAPAPL